MKKRILSLSMVISMTFSILTGCGNQVNTVRASEVGVTENSDYAFIARKASPFSAFAKEISVLNNAALVSVDNERPIEKVDTESSVSNGKNQEVVTSFFGTKKNTTEQPVNEVIAPANGYTEIDVDGMTSNQRNSLNMLNYLTVLTQEINDSKGSRLYVENAYSSLLNNTFPNAVDSRTQAQLINILDTLEGYRMVDVKRERLEFIYEQNRAQAMRHAVPNPMSVLNIVQSKNLLKSAASVVYMAVDSYASYSSYIEQADLQYLQDGWELDDEEIKELYNSRKQAFTYMLSMVRDNDLPGDYALNEESVQEFVMWKNEPNVVRRISFLESNQSAYEAFGMYWLTLAESYYEYGEYQKCLDAIAKYEEISSRIFRKDYDYAKVLPLGIVAAKEEYEKEKYKEVAEEYAETILNNCDNTDWTLMYFVAQIYLDLYAQTDEISYAEKAYKIAYDNVNYLVDEQKDLNDKYLANVEEAEIPKDATKREKEEIKQYNKMLKAERKIALPPISEALYLNCDLLFALADELNISSKEKTKIDSILHENDDPIFLMQVIDNRFWFEKAKGINIDEVDVFFDGEEFVIPATYMTSDSSIIVTVDNAGEKTVFDDWSINEVIRKKNTAYTDFTASFTSKMAGEFKYSDGMEIVIEVIPIAESPDEVMEFTYNVVGVKKAFIFNGIQFERVEK